jgi:hypothetical protein
LPVVPRLIARAKGTGEGGGSRRRVASFNIDELRDAVHGGSLPDEKNLKDLRKTI